MERRYSGDEKFVPQDMLEWSRAEDDGYHIPEQVKAEPQIFLYDDEDNKALDRMTTEGGR